MTLRTVLVVDDNEIDRAILFKQLNAKYNVIQARNGEEAIAAISKNFRTISAIILDIVMPGVDGFAVLKKIRVNSLYLQIPIIIATSSLDEETERKALELGANGFLTKPYNPYMLLSCLHNAISLRENAALANTMRFDKLTKLLNRDSFFMEAERMIKRHKPGYYVMSCVDIDNFKVINDQYGIAMGDEVLKHVAGSIDTCIKEIDGLACRFTADRFAMLFPAEYINSDIVNDNHELTKSPKCIKRQIKIRIGRYVINDTTQPANVMFDRATMAQESIKGRYDVYLAEYNDAMRMRILNEQRIVNEMSDALAGEQFEPWFQPQYNHATGEMIGSEALVRWKKDGTFISPVEFVPVFEKNGFIYKLDRYIWEQVCIHLRRWIDEGKTPLPVSVNISRFDIYQDDFFESLCSLTNRYEIPTHLLRLEVTESAFADSTNRIQKTVNSLIEHGFTVEIDDFGSGYSSLNTLKDVEASILKLDMKFFEDTDNTQRSGNIIESVVRMAKWLGMSVIAEGVEDMAQAEFLKSIGCYYIQGFLYAKPMPLEEYEKLTVISQLNPDLAQLQTVERLNNNEFWNPKSMDTLIFNSYVGGACIFEYRNGETELLRVNDQYKRELGCSMSKNAGISEMDIKNYLDDDKLVILTDCINKCIVEKKENSCEVCLYFGGHHPESTQYLRITMRLLATTDDRCLFYSVILNMTAQRNAERKQIESETKLQMSFQKTFQVALSTMMDVTDDISFVKDNNLRYLCCSHTVADAIGLEHPEDIVGKSDYDLFDKKIADKYIAEDRRIMKSGLSLTGYTESIPQKDGSIRLTSASKYPVMDTNGNVIGIYGYSRDITKSKTKSAQLQLLSESIPGGIASYLLSTESICMLYFNDGFYKPMGYSRDEYTKITAGSPLTLVVPDDRAALRAAIREIRSGNSGAVEDFTVRARTKSGEYKWLNLKITVTNLSKDKYILNVVQFDITKQKQTEENLRRTQEEYRLALEHSGLVISRLNITKRILEMTPDAAKSLNLEEHMDNIPHNPILLNKISSDTIEAYVGFYESILSGKKNCSASFQVRLPKGLRWVTAHSTTIFSPDGAPVSAIISYVDTTDRNEKEEIFKKWQQSLDDRLRDSYTLFRCDLSKEAGFDSSEGTLIHFDLDPSNTFDECTDAYANQKVCNEDREAYIESLKVDKLIADYYRGKRSVIFEYRETIQPDSVRWLKRSVDLVERPNSTGLMAYMMFENIDETKKSELHTRVLAQTDPLTGVLNRKAFVSEFRQMLRNRKQDSFVALLLMDIDNFKHINDNFGHAAGDTALVETAQALRSQVRESDLVCRVGGDEFIICLSDLPDKKTIESKARSICSCVNEILIHSTRLTASLGICICPDNGNTFDEMYKNADLALYDVKNKGKNDFSFFKK